MNVLFIIPYDHNVFFPQGFAYVAAQARKEGHNVTTLDLAAYRLSPDHFTRIIRETRFDVAAVGGVIHQYASMEWIAREIKRLRPEALVVAGGTAVTIAYEIILKNCDFDAVFVDEAVFSFSEYLRAIESGDDIGKIDGLFRIDENGAISGRRRAFIEDLDDLPLPAWDLFPMDIYLKEQSRDFIVPGIWIATSRGCPYSCTFCRNTKSGKMRYHSVDRILHEIEILHGKYGSDAFRFTDDNFMENPERVEAICDGILDRGLDILWQCHSRADFKDFHLLDKLYRAGCRGFMIGMESGSQKILDALKKNLDVNQARETIIKLMKCGIEPNNAFMLGSPGETRETMNDTYEFIKSCGFPKRTFNFLTPVPSSYLWDKLITEGIIKDPAEYLRTRATFLTLAVNMTTLKDEELIKEINIMRGKVSRDDKSAPITRQEKEKFYGKRILQKTETRALLYHDYPAFLFFHPGTHKIHQNKRFFRQKKYVLPQIEKRLASLSSVDFRLSLQGAEPTENPYLEDILKLPIFASFTHLRLYSDGQRLSDKAFLKRILGLGVTEFVIEICGPDAESHELHTGEPGSFSQTLEGMRNIISLTHPMMAAVPLTQFNIHRLQEFPSLLSDTGANIVQLSYAPNLSAEEPHAVFPDLDKVCQALGGALNVFDRAGLLVRVDGVPICALAGREHLYYSKIGVCCIDTLDEPMRNPLFEGKFLHGPMCANCSRSQRCMGVHPDVYKIYGWKGLNTIT